MTISLCMIVKNEEKLLSRCLESIKDLVDEIIIVDTGSTDSTKEVAFSYTPLVYDYVWEDDFSRARNFSFEKATMDYIYVADADEYLDEDNRRQFLLLKDNLLPEIEIVQMMYNTISEDTVLNIKKEYRPKLFKRLRTFRWEDPIHETVRLMPLVFDSDVVITHAPDSNHSKRDFAIYQKALARDGYLSKKVILMYCTELYKCAEFEDLKTASPYLTQVFNSTEDLKVYQATAAVLCRYLRLEGNQSDFLDNALAIEDSHNTCSEISFELGQYFYDKGDFSQAAHHLDIACHATSPAIDIHSGGDTALSLLVEAYKKLPACSQQLQNTITELQNWEMPSEDKLF